jgi:hypothetical protein
VPCVTAALLRADYLLLVEPIASRSGARPMTKFYALIAACAVFAPLAFATLNQAALIVG